MLYREEQNTALNEDAKRQNDDEQFTGWPRKKQQRRVMHAIDNFRAV